MHRYILTIFAISVFGALAPGDSLAAGDEYVIHLADDGDADGILIEVADTGLDSDSEDVGDDFAVTVPESGNFAGLWLVIPNPRIIPIVVDGRVDLPDYSSSFTVVLWEDVDADGLYGENVDSVLDADTTDSNGQYSLNVPNNFNGEAGILIYLGDEFENGDTITGCVGCSS